MGLFGQQQERREQSAAMASEAVAGCPDPARHYVATVNKGSMNVTMLSGVLNVQYAKGYRLSQAFEQDGNTVTVFEHNHP